MTQNGQDTLLSLIAGQLRPTVKTGGVSFGGVSTVGTGHAPTVLGGTSRGTVLGGMNRGNVLGGTSRGTVLGGTSRGTVLGGTSRGTVLGGTSRGTVLGGMNRGNVLGGTSRGTVLGGTSRGTVLGGTSRGTVLGGTSRGTVLGKRAEQRTDTSGRRYNLLQAIRTPSYTAKPPAQPKTVVPDVQYGMPKAVTPGSDSTKPTTSSGSEAPNPVKVAQQSKEWDRAMSAMRTGRRAPAQPRGMQGPVYPAAPKVAPSSGDSYYDNLQSTKDRLSREAIERRKQEVFRKSDIQQEMTPEQLQKEMKGFKSWGSSAPSWLRNAVAKGHEWVGNAVDFYSGRKMNGQQFAEEAANDTLNNWQGMWEGAKRSGGNALRSMASLGSHVVPGGSSYKMQKFRQGLANATANADAMYDAKRDVLENSSQTGLDAHTTLGTINNATRNFFGNIAGETAAMGAVGGAAGVGAKAIRGTAGIAGRVAGNAVTKAVQPAMQKMRYVQSGFGNTAKNLAAAEGRAGMAPTQAMRQRFANAMTRGNYDDRLMWGAKAGKTFRPGNVANFEERLGGAVNDSFRMVGDVMAKPLQVGSDVMLHPFQTANSGYARIAPGLRAMRHPVQSAGNFGRNFAMHPWKSTGHGMGNAGKFVFNPKTWAYAQMPGVYGDMFSGNFGDAARGMGTMGATKFMFAAPGAVQLPMLAHDARGLIGGGR